ncbi:MAG: DUF4185 domain-containing protein [Candidatus Binataceae bacterium]
MPQFPYEQGWLGGDGAYSIPLNAGRILWLFGDSFASPKGLASRKGSKLVANTVAISTCRNHDWSIQYYFGKHRSPGSPQAFFDSDTNKVRFWPLDGFVFHSSLYVFILEVAATGTGTFAFKPIGAKLAKVSNPAAGPDKWNVRYRELLSDSQVVPGVSAVVATPYVYLYAVVSKGAPRTHQAILARIGLENLDSPAAGIEYLDSASGWKRGLNERDAQIIVGGVAAEFSVRYHPEIARWVMVQTDPGFPASQIGVRTADRLQGPWSTFRPLYEIPEMRGATARAERVFCYGAKQHAGLSSSLNSLSITYVCSSLSFERQIRDLALYRPRAIELHLR